ncbi:MAG: hypothetical protein FE78DRAFT_420998 [Acidomyces sp. 'richmondensis']|nr:MAG: hypothetical protein FE78DRAFT_420998 [Acidomyces sp. 'richmondensis']
MASGKTLFTGIYKGPRVLLSQVGRRKSSQTMPPDKFRIAANCAVWDVLEKRQCA